MDRFNEMMCNPNRLGLNLMGKKEEGFTPKRMVIGSKLLIG